MLLFYTLFSRSWRFARGRTSGIQSLFIIAKKPNHNVSFYEWLRHGIWLASDKGLLVGNIVMFPLCSWKLETKKKAKELEKNNDRQQQSVQTINLELIPKSENAHLPYTIKPWEDPDVSVCGVSSPLNRQFTFVLYASLSIQLIWDNSGFVWQNQCCLSEERERG